MNPACTVGIDIGTTYTKAVVLCADGSLGGVLRAGTPTRAQHGATFFDLPALEAEVDRLLGAVRAAHRVMGVSFTSVGESVVPVRGGRALANALVWHDPATEAVERRFRAEIDRELPQDRRGCTSSSTLSIYKILWMREALGLEEPEAWLPLSAYFVYRATRQARWDYSQASRTMLLDVPAGRWCAGLLRRFGLEAALPPLAPMGTLLGTDEHGTAYALGGHDQLTGLFCVRAVLGEKPFVFDSLGSSESVVTLTGSRSPFSSTGGLYVGAAFGPGLFYVLGSLRSSGTLLECLARLGGGREAGSYYGALNARMLEHRERLGEAFPLLAGGDAFAGEGVHTLTLMNVPLDAGPESVAHSAYVYLATMARLLVERIGAFADPDPILVASGAATANELYMRYRATIIGRPLHVLENEEIGGIGAALCAAAGLGGRSTIEAFAGRQVSRIVEPGQDPVPGLRDQSDALVEQCQGILERTLREALA